jgi:alpha-ketoglutarate-dependent taurine dioxygenase
MFEHVPSDYACLKMHTLPPSGGDTLWASGYELFDRFSVPFQKMLSGLTVTSSQQTFTSAAKKGGYDLILENRGAPENHGDHFTATHPVVRTNPVTSRNSIYALGLHAKGIDGVTQAESDILMKMFLDTITQNHDIQVRFKWSKNDVAIWDNRCVYHRYAYLPKSDAHADIGRSGTADFSDDFPRAGVRVTSIGERPYFDRTTLP